MNKTNPLKRFLAIRGMGQVITVFCGLVILCAVFSFLNPTFYSERNVSNLLRQIAPILIIGIGQSYVLITGNIDLSIGSTVGMSCMMSATLMTKGVNQWLAVLITLCACMALGFVNGQLVARFKLPPFIATLGTMTVARGIAQLVNNNYNTGSIGEKAQDFRNFFYYGRPISVTFLDGLIEKFDNAFVSGVIGVLKFINFYNTIWIAVVLWIVFNFILGKTRTGRHVYAIGSNVEAARLSGVSVTSTTTAAYLVSAFCACVAGLVTCAISGMGAMDAGTSHELYAVAASVIGGVSTMGGQGILLGTVIGAAIWGVLQNGLQFAGAPVAYRNIIIGVIVVVSVLLDVLVRRGNKVKIRKRKEDLRGTPSP